MTGRELAIRTGHRPEEASRWKKGKRPCPGGAVAFLELVIIARRCGITFEPGARVGMPRKAHSAAAA